MPVITKDGWYRTEEEIKEIADRQHAEGIKIAQVVCSVTRSKEKLDTGKIQLLKNVYHKPTLEEEKEIKALMNQINLG